MSSDKRSDIYWVGADGREVDETFWADMDTRHLGIVLNGEALSEMNARGMPIKDDIWFLGFNAHWEDLEFRLPGNPAVTNWKPIVDTSRGIAVDEDAIAAQDTFTLRARSVVAFLRERIEGSRAERRPWLEQIKPLPA